MTEIMTDQRILTETMKEREDIWSALYASTRLIKWKKRLKPENMIARATATARSLLQDGEQKIQEMRSHNDITVAMKLIKQGYRYEPVYLALKAESPAVREKHPDSRHDYLVDVVSKAALKTLEEVNPGLCEAILFKDHLFYEEDCREIQRF